ncbi:hypothetical protein NDU88_011543 [Pleurodeles waltl]|uniref:Uncharacterized protein n=1 Tax=Pleurodeles waltl TaxID=8319 RepID=A0AAV7S6H1_PLEWA|nr:hypothetical protein NDU88_011543 [Pleurodeles waltl]
MASQRHNNKRVSLKNLLNKTPAKKASPPGVPVMEGRGETAEPGPSEGGEAPLTRTFMEQLFGPYVKRPVDAECRRALRPVMDFIREKCIRYKWGHPFHFHLIWQNETHSIRTLEEAQGLDGMPPHPRDKTQQPASQVQPPRVDKRRSKTHTRLNKSHKPTLVENQKERAALLRSLRSRDSISEVD